MQVIINDLAKQLQKRIDTALNDYVRLCDAAGCDRREAAMELLTVVLQFAALVASGASLTAEQVAAVLAPSIAECNARRDK